MPVTLDLSATSFGSMLLGLLGVRLKNSGGNLHIRNNGDTAFAEVTASRVNVSDNVLVLNSDAAGSAADWTLTIQRPAAGQTAAWTWQFPVGPGTAGQVLSTDGTGATSWISTVSTADKISTDTTTLAFGSAATVAMFTLPANAEILEIRVTIDTPWNTAATMSVGIAGTTSKYMAATQVNLQGAATNCFEVYPGLTPSASPENLIITYAAASATAGSARILVKYAVPS